MSFDEGTFVEPLACVVRGQRLANVDRDSTILIIGTGLAGLLHVKVAKLKGISHIIAADINQHRLNIAKQFGAQHTINAKEDIIQKLKEVNENRLADRIIVSSGATQAATTALDCVDKGGTILFFAVPDPTFKLPLPITQFWRNEITIKTSYGAAPMDLNEAFTLLAEKKITVEDMITHRLSLNNAAEGFRLTAEAGESLKVILKPN